MPKLIQTPPARKSKILRKPEVVDLVGLSYTTLWRMEKSGDFPGRVVLGPRSMGWFQDEILDWLDSRPRFSDPCGKARPEK